MCIYIHIHNIYTHICIYTHTFSIYRVKDLSVWFSSVAQSCPSLCNPMDCRMPGFPVHHQLPELAQTHAHQVGHAIQPSPPLSSPSPPTFNLSWQKSPFNKAVLHIRSPKYWRFSLSIRPSNEYSELSSFRMTGLISLLSRGLSRVLSNTTVQKHQFFSTLLSL